MPYNPFDRAERRVNALERLSQETNLTRVEEGSLLNRTVDVILAEVDAVENRTMEARTEANPVTSRGAYQELWGEFLGVERIAASRAYARAEDQVYRFYVESGTFGDLNDGQDIFLPQATTRIVGTNQLVTDIGLQEFPLQYDLLGDVTLPAAASELYIGIVASQPGSDFNVGVGQLKDHSFIEYPTYPEKLLLGMNVMPIVNGEDEEDEETYAYKISRANHLRPESGISRMESEIDQIPGVSETFSRAGLSGSGTVDIFVDAESFIVPPALLSEANALSGAFQLSGVQVNIEPVRRVGFSLDSTVTFKPGVDEDTRRAIRQDLETKVLEEVIEVGRAGRLDLDTLYRRLSLSNTEISSIGQQDSFDEVTLYREGIDGRRSGEVLANSRDLLLFGDLERLLPEDNLISPVLFREA